MQAIVHEWRKETHLGVISSSCTRQASPSCVLCCASQDRVWMYATLWWQVYAVTYSHTGVCFALCALDENRRNVISLWSTQSNKCIGTAVGHSKQASSHPHLNLIHRPSRVPYLKLVLAPATTPCSLLHMVLWLVLPCPYFCTDADLSCL